MVLATPGAPVRLCPPSFVRFSARQWGDPGDGPEPPVCDDGLPAEGVDVAALQHKTEHGGATWGTAWVSGVLADGTFTVVEQGAPRREDERSTALHEVPCPEPPGGWRGDKPIPGEYGKSAEGDRLYEQPRMDAVDRYGARHPGEVVHNRYALPERNTSVVVVAVFDLAQAERELRPVYGDRLCLVRSRYSIAQVKAAKKAAGDMVGTAGVHSGGGYTASADGQPLISLDADLPNAEIDAFLAAQPEGLVRVDYWLAPVKP